jgi:hypothetical protein
MHQMVRRSRQEELPVQLMCLWEGTN